MFIELTDHLRCPADHEERYLVLLPDEIVDRSVRAGQLGCPVCGRTFAVRDGIAELGEPPSFPLGAPAGAVARAGAAAGADAEPRTVAQAETEAQAEADTGAPLAAAAMHPLLGLSGPGGYAVVVGDVAAAWRALVELNPGVAFVAVNPPPGVGDAAPRLSAVRSTMLPLKSRSMRGVVLGPGYGADPAWVREAARITLPGLRVVGQGPEPNEPSLDLLAIARGCWVAARR